MRGLQPQNNPGTVYLSVKHGTICQESKKERPGFDPIEVTDPSTGESFFKFIKAYAGVEAMVTDIKFRSEVFDGRPYISWRISLCADDGPPMVLELPFNSNVGDRFMRCAENIDWTRPVEFRAWREKETKKTAFMIGQREAEIDEKAVNIPQLYTKDNPGDCPPARQRFDKTWDFEAQKEFLYQRMVEVVIPRVHAANGTKAAEPEHAAEPEADPFAKAEPTGRTESYQPEREIPPQSKGAQPPADDPFAKRPASPGAATGSAGPVTAATLGTLQALANKRTELPPFNEIANRLFQRNVVDLTEGQAIAMTKYVGEL